MPTKQPYSASIRPRSRKDGTVAFDVRYRQDGKSQSLAFDFQDKAESWANIVRAIGPAEALKYLQISTVEGTPTLAEYAERYITKKSGIEPGTRASYRSYMRLHIGPTMGHLPLDAITADTIASWINLRTSQGAAAKTIKLDHGFLSALFLDAVDAGIITKNPCSRSTLPESESVEMVFLSADEFTHLLAYIPTRYQPLVLLLATTGLRWGEATALRPADFDLDRKTVRVSRAWKNSRTAGFYIGPPKTRKSKRTVSLPDDVIEVLRPLLEAGTEYVFTNAFGKPVRQQNFHEAVWSPAVRLANGKPAFEKSKLYPDRDWSARSGGPWAGRKPAKKPLGKIPRVHDLRHSHASWLLLAGVSIVVVQGRLGHESITTTVDRYGHISEEYAARAGEVIGQVLAGSMPSIVA